MAETANFSGDPLVYIASANLARRNLTKGQSAMLTAMLHPEPGSRIKKDAAKIAVSAGFSGRRLAEARQVLRHSQKIAEAVVRGDTSLDDLIFIFCAFLKPSPGRRSQANSSPHSNVFQLSLAASCAMVG